MGEPDSRLFSPEAHEPLRGEGWDADRVRERVAGMVAEAVAAFDPAGLWPAAPGWDTWRGHARVPLKALYAGAAGVLWALQVVRERGLADVDLDLGAAAGRVLERWRVKVFRIVRLLP